MVQRMVPAAKIARADKISKSPSAPPGERRPVRSRLQAPGSRMRDKKHRTDHPAHPNRGKKGPDIPPPPTVRIFAPPTVRTSVPLPLSGFLPLRPSGFRRSFPPSGFRHPHPSAPVFTPFRPHRTSPPPVVIAPSARIHALPVCSLLPHQLPIRLHRFTPFPPTPEARLPVPFCRQPSPPPRTRHRPSAPRHAFLSVRASPPAGPRRQPVSRAPAGIRTPSAPEMSENQRPNGKISAPHFAQSPFFVIFAPALSLINF